MKCGVVVYVQLHSELESCYGKSYADSHNTTPCGCDEGYRPAMQPPPEPFTKSLPKPPDFEEHRKDVESKMTEAAAVPRRRRRPVEDDDEVDLGGFS